MFVAFLLVIVSCFIILLKNENAFKNQIIITDAIHNYLQDHINESSVEEIVYMYSSIENYDKTLLRLYDWGYEHIVPADIFEKIEPYIGKE